jgi:hypothetical protein
VKHGKQYRRALSVNQLEAIRSSMHLKGCMLLRFLFLYAVVQTPLYLLFQHNFIAMRLVFLAWDCFWGMGGYNIKHSEKHYLGALECAKDWTKRFAGWNLRYKTTKI